MTINHLKNRDSQQKTLTVAFGRHAVKGHLCWSYTEGASPSHRIIAYNALGEGEWDACESAFYRGIYMPPADIHFHPGGIAQDMNEVDPYFTKDVPHTRTASLGYKCPVGIGDFDTEKNPPLDFEGIFRTKKCPDFNSSGVQTGFSYSANPARCLVEALMTYARLPNLPASYNTLADYWLTRIDWISWRAWHDYCAGAETVDYSTLPDLDGFGLTARYYNGIDFDTLVTKFVQPVIDLNVATASPAPGVDADNFSAKFEGKIKAKVSGDIDFTLIHDDGGRLTIDGQPVIDNWFFNATDTGQIAMVEGEFYDIRVEWRETGGPGNLRLEWSNKDLPVEVVPSKYLYPSVEQRPRYESHVYFDTRTNFADVIRTVLLVSNSVMQDVNGKLRFHCLEQMTTPSFTFTGANIDNFKFRRRDILQNDPITSYEAKFRDLDSQFLEEPQTPIHIELDYFMRKNYENVKVINLFNTTRWQARKVLEARARLETGNDLLAEVEAKMAKTYPVVAGDLVSVQHRKIGPVARNYLVREATDGSVAEATGSRGSEPEMRTFTLQEWPPLP